MLGFLVGCSVFHFLTKILGQIEYRLVEDESRSSAWTVWWAMQAVLGVSVHALNGRHAYSHTQRPLLVWLVLYKWSRCQRMAAETSEIALTWSLLQDTAEVLLTLPVAVWSSYDLVTRSCVLWPYTEIHSVVSSSSYTNRYNLLWTSCAHRRSKDNRCLRVKRVFCKRNEQAAGEPQDKVCFLLSIQSGKRCRCAHKPNVGTSWADGGSNTIWSSNPFKSVTLVWHSITHCTIQEHSVKRKQHFKASISVNF